MLLTEQQDIANEFGEFFANVGRDCAQQIPAAKNKIEHYLSKIPNSAESLFIAPTNELEILSKYCDPNQAVDMMD